MSQTNVTLHFDIMRDGQLQGSEQFDLDAIKVGKLSSSHLRLDDPNVSRIHAVIERGSDGSYTVIDLGSASGTFVNGEKVTKSEVNDGDELQFGDTVLRVRLAAAELPAPPAPPTAPAGVYANEFGGNEATVVTQAGAADVVAPQPQAASTPARQPEGLEVGHVRLEDGSSVEAFTMEGYYDDSGNYHPGYYDESGAYHQGYGFPDDDGQWQVLQGYYDPNGEWISADGADFSATVQGPSDTELYTNSFFAEAGGDTLEIAFLWTDHVLSVTSYHKPRTVLVGSEESNDFVLEDASLSAPAFPLVAYREGGGYFVTLTPQMQGLIQNGDQQFSVQEIIERGAATKSDEVPGAYALPIGARTSVRLDLGGNTFLIHFTSIPVLLGGTLPIDKAPIPYLAASAAAHILFLLLAMSMPDDARSLNLDGFDANDRFVQLMIKPDQEEEEPKPDWLGGDEEEAAKHKGEEGQAGKEDSEQVNKELQIEGPKDNTEIEIKKARDTEIAVNAGALAVFNDNQLSSMWGASDNSVGSDAIHALGNLTGDGAGEARGMGGLGLHGAGRGGGGVSERGIGLANVGTAGRGGGGRGGSGYGKHSADLGDRKTLEPKIVPGRPAITGSLDREIIQRVVRQHRREITYCYETELQKNRNLAGRVVVRFTISATGSVVSAVTAETSLNNAAVERCMSERIRRWVFPEPKGGGIVIVNYPFNFST
ncbi:MAG: TonB family protein [Bradymonadaceae bacterium]|nr:TonB family protein [Lujinxingiaceae bacterium]